MFREKTDGRLEQVAKLLEEIVDDNTAIVGELKRLERTQQVVGADIERSVSLLRDDLTGGLAYRALKDLCSELIGPLAAAEAMLERADFADPDIVAGHVRSICVTLRGVLRRMGAEKMHVVVGQDRYDPQRHQCVGIVDPERSPFPEAAPHTVVRVVEDGYILDRRPLTPVRVEIQASRPESGNHT
jgi:molecular chaperone GrpE (heat shock protein)